MTYTKIPYSVVDVKNIDFSSGKKSVKKLAENLLHGKSLFNYSNQAIRVVPADVIRYTSQTRSLLNKDLYRNSLINFVLSCEKNCAGSGFIFLLLLTDEANIHKKRKLRLETQDLKEVVNFYTGRGTIAKKALELFYTCGFEYNISYDSNHVDDVEIVIGTSEGLPGHADPLFYDVELDDDYAIVCIDGNVETLGEIDPLLQWSIKNNKKSIILANNFSPDVSNTLRKNWDLGKLSVFPYVVNEAGLEFAKKFCKKVVSTDTGLRLSNMDLDSNDSFPVLKKAEKDLCISAGSDDGNTVNVNFIFPIRLKHAHELIKERIQFAIALTKNCLIKGISLIEYKGIQIKIPTTCLDYALRAQKEWRKIEEVDCVVSLEQKNSL